jgi:hypothetical protein
MEAGRISVAENHVHRSVASATFYGMRLWRLYCKFMAHRLMFLQIVDCEHSAAILPPSAMIFGVSSYYSVDKRTNRGFRRRELCQAALFARNVEYPKIQRRGRFTVRQPLGPGCRNQGPRVPAQPARYRHGEAGLQGLPRTARLSAFATNLQRRHPPTRNVCYGRARAPRTRLPPTFFTSRHWQRCSRSIPCPEAP